MYPDILNNLQSMINTGVINLNELSFAVENYNYIYITVSSSSDSSKYSNIKAYVSLIPSYSHTTPLVMNRIYYNNFIKGNQWPLIYPIKKDNRHTQLIVDVAMNSLLVDFVYCFPREKFDEYKNSTFKEVEKYDSNGKTSLLFNIGTNSTSMYLVFFPTSFKDFDDTQGKNVKFMFRYQQGNNMKLLIPNKELQYNIIKNTKTQISNVNIIVSDTVKGNNQVIKGNYYIRVFNKQNITDISTITSLLLKDKAIIVQKIEVIDELTVTFTLNNYPNNIDTIVIVNAVVEGNEGFTYNPLEIRVDLKASSIIWTVLGIIGLVIMFAFLVYVMYKKITKKSVDAGIAFDEVDQGNVIVDWETVYIK